MLLCTAGVSGQDHYPTIKSLFAKLPNASRKVLDIEPLTFDAGTAVALAITKDPGAHIQGMAMQLDGRYAISHNGGTPWPASGEFSLLLSEGRSSTSHEQIHLGFSHPLGISSSGKLIASNCVSQGGSKGWGRLYDENANNKSSKLSNTHYEAPPALVYHPKHECYYLLLGEWSSSAGKMDYYLYQSTGSAPNLSFNFKFKAKHNRYSEAGSFLIYDANDENTLYHASPDRYPSGSGYKERIRLSSLNLASETWSNEGDYPLSSSFTGFYDDPKSGFRWAGSVYVDQYRGVIEVAAAPRNINQVSWDFHKWNGSVTPSAYQGDDETYIFQRDVLYDVNAGTGVSARSGTTTSSFEAAAILDDVIYYVDGGVLKRHDLCQARTLPPISTPTAWSGTSCMTSGDGYLWIMQKGTIYRVDHSGAYTQIGNKGAWTQSGARGGFAMAFAKGSMYVIEENNDFPFQSTKLWRAKTNGSNTAIATLVFGSLTFPMVMTSLNDKLYIVVGDILSEYELDGSERRLTDGWGNSMAMGATSDNMLAIAQNDKLYRVDPGTGGWRKVGTENWSNTKAILRTQGSAASVSSYGTGCGASSSSPMTLSTSALPILGSTMDLSIQNVPAGTTATYLLVGVSNPGLNLGVIGMTGCSLLTDGLLATLTGNNGQIQYQVSPKCKYVGVSLYLQAVTLSPGTNPLGIASSNGLRLVPGLF